MNPLLASGAFVTGLLGSGHCVGMCGGIVAALSLSGGRQAGVLFHVLYNLGRVATYTFLGYLVGWLGLAVAYTGGYRQAGSVVMIGADIFVIVVGLGSAGAFRSLNVMTLEFPGPVRSLTSAVRVLRRLPAAVSALPLGLALGFIPCGFLYAVLLNAALTADPTSGAQVMLGFGLGTVPAVLSFGSLAHFLGARARGWMLRGAGAAVAVMGLINLVRHLRSAGCC